MMIARQVWDATAGVVVHAARQRGHQVLTGDADRLTRIDPDASLDVIA